MALNGSTTYYQVTSSSDTPPASGWAVADGLTPAPTIAPVTADTTPPVFSSASINEAGDVLTIDFLEVASPPLQPATGVTGFAVMVNDSPRAISSATAAGTQVFLNLASPVYAGESVTVAYNGGNVSDSAGL